MRVTESAGVALFTVGIASAALQLILLVGRCWRNKRPMPATAANLPKIWRGARSSASIVAKTKPTATRRWPTIVRDSISHSVPSPRRHQRRCALRVLREQGPHHDAGRRLGKSVQPVDRAPRARRTLELNPNHNDALAAKGGMYRQMPWVLGGSLAKAATYLSRSVDLDPDAVSARIELAEVYRDMGQPERSVPLLEKAAQVAERVGKYRQLGEAPRAPRRIERATLADRGAPLN